METKKLKLLIKQPSINNNSIDINKHINKNITLNNNTIDTNPSTPITETQSILLSTLSTDENTKKTVKKQRKLLKKPSYFLLIES